METNNLAKKIRKRFDHQQARRLLRDKYQGKMTFAHNGALWQAGPELILLCTTCLEVGEPNPVLEDLNRNPTQVDAQELKNMATGLWQEQMNAWLDEYNTMSRQR